MATDLLPHLVVVANAPLDLSSVDMDGAQIYEPPPHARPYYRPVQNLGISRTMNWALDRMLEQGNDMLIWLSTSIRFGPDGGTRLVEATGCSELGVVGMPTQWHAVGIRPLAFELAGRWDENFFPGYAEDTDWRRRLTLATGLSALPEVEIGSEARDGHGYDLLLAANARKTVVNFHAHFRYYADKWGGAPLQWNVSETEETFDLPWGDKPLGYWEPATREDLIDRYGLGR